MRKAGTARRTASSAANPCDRLPALRRPIAAIFGLWARRQAGRGVLLTMKLWDAAARIRTEDLNVTAR